jgi:V/A-type H+-transporting ATPase subunit I
MGLRPTPAKWFELLISRDELGVALQSLAATGAVELQAHSDTTAATLLPVLRAAVDEYRRLAERYAAWWPPPTSVAAQGVRAPEDIAAAALKQLHSWAADADPVIGRLQILEHERAELELLGPLLSAARADLPDLHAFTRAGPVLASRAYLLAGESYEWEVPPSVILQSVRAGERSYLLAVGPAEQIAVLDDRLSAHKARRLVLPSALPAQGAAAMDWCRARTEQISGELRSVGATLEELHRRHGLSAALDDLAFIEWVVQNVPQLALTEHFAWLTGWASDLKGGRIQSVLNRRQLHFLLRFPQAPRGLLRPMVLYNPWWAQPFELFSRLLGMPDANEADSSRLLAVVAPLMFGFMFADVGQGAVLVVAGAVLRKRFPSTAMLIPGGQAAILFGFLFGGIFANESALPALWVRPLDRPLLLLGASLAFGAAVILLGLALDALQHAWSGAAAEWWATRAGLVLCYAGMICAPFDIRALGVIPVGLGWYLIGNAVIAPGKRLDSLGRAAAESLETLLQLAVNTISFMRVGAFALAHAGLGEAVAGLAAAAGSRPGAWLVLVAGNALIIAIEGLVVGIQTTRLVLFEFFIRFLQGSGRAFHPLASPPAAPASPPPSRRLS